MMDNQLSQFQQTHWSVIQKAMDSENPEFAQALSALCHRYWRPLYVHARKKGKSSHDAEDLVQGFLAEMIREKYHCAADASKGRFRTFLLKMFDRFMIRDWKKGQAIKRGGQEAHVSLDYQLAESLFKESSKNELPSEAVYDRGWALELLRQVNDQLKSEFAKKGHSEKFYLIRPFLPGAGETSKMETVAESAQIPIGTLKSDIHRVRSRFKKIMREHIASTVADPKDIDEELKYLASLLRASG